MTTELLLPDFHTLRIGIFGMIDAQPVTKNTLQATHDLHGQSNLGQEIEHLLFLFQCLTNQVDIEFSLTARGDTMQKGHVFLEERELNLVIGILLSNAEGLDFIQMRLSTVIQTSNFLFINL